MATNTRDAAGDLPDELLLDIFARLSTDPLDLLHCAATCTRWLRLLAANHAAFLRRAGALQQERNATILLGTFNQNDYLVHGPTATVNKNTTISYCPPKFRRVDKLWHPCLGLLSLSVYPKQDRLFNCVKPLASRRGLLLMRLIPTTLDYQKLHLAVGHPVLGGVHLMPPPALHLHPPFQGRDVTSYALLTGYGGEALHDRRQRRLAFRVLFTAVCLDEVVYAYSYSSATGRWSAPIVCPPQLRQLTMSGPRAGIIDCGGTAHWLYRDMAYFYTLDVSADATHVSLTKIPIPRRVSQPQPPFPCITRGGKLSFVIRRPDCNMLELWTKRDDQDEDGDADWIHYDLARFQNPFTPFKIIGFAESRGAVLIKSYLGLFCLDLESKVFELVRRSKYSTYPREYCMYQYHVSRIQ